MTADEAVQLVLQAAVIGRSGEALVLDMGEQIRIADMARRLVAAVPRPVEIVFTGLRPGEKLTEDLLGASEPDVRPCHPLIRQVSGHGAGPAPGHQPGRGREPRTDPGRPGRVHTGLRDLDRRPGGRLAGGRDPARPAAQPALPIRSLT